MASESDLQGEEIAAIVNEIRERVRSRYPEGQARGLGVPLPDLLPILHARDSAEGKVAAIGSVNPRTGGPVNNVIQWVKRNIARGLGWFVRDQVEFNRAVLVAVEATLESLNEVNRTFVAAGGQIDELRESVRSALEALHAEELKDLRSHWIHWRDEWQEKLLRNEVHYLRGLAEMQGLLDSRLHSLEISYRDALRKQHSEFEGSAAQSLGDLQKQFWKDMENVRLDYERLIHNELRVLRQKAFSSNPTPPAAIASPAAAETPLNIDYARFSDRFRGSEEYVRERQQFYVPYFKGRSRVLDIGCGRGEFLGLMREAGVTATGVDLDPESVAACVAKGFEAVTADVFTLLNGEPDGSYDGIFASQVIEHLKPAEVPALVKLCSSKLRPGGILALETPNPECLAIFATHFYLDPTHQRPVPPGLLVFYFEEFGLGNVEIHRLSPAVESMPSLNELPAAFRESFFGSLDYCAIGRKL